MLRYMCQGSPVIKTRHYVKFESHVWEIDEFHAENQGLIVAEVELQDEAEYFQRPDWLGEEVSADPKYLNVALVQNPYCNWTT